MTLGGLALAVGILVDDATVTIENINWHLEQGKEVEPAILDGAHQIVMPAFVSLLCICIVFVPMFFLDGVARFLFVPMAEAVMFAMICSFILSRTLVPTMAMYLLQAASAPCRKTAPAPPRAIRWCGSSAASRPASSSFRERLPRPADAGAAAPARLRRSASWLSSPRRSCWCRFSAANFFPSVDAGQILMHVRTQVGTRVEESAKQFADDREGDPHDHPAGGTRRRSSTISACRSAASI